MPSGHQGKGWQQLTDRMGEVERLHSSVAKDAAAMQAMGVLVEAKALKLDMHGEGKLWFISELAGFPSWQGFQAFPTPSGWIGLVKLVQVCQIANLPQKRSGAVQVLLHGSFPE